MAASEGQRTLLALLSADVAGYSRLMQDDERATVRTLTECRGVFAEHVTGHGGRVVDAPGDNLLAAFHSPVEAVAAAVAVQGELARRNAALPEHRRMVFRIGVNLGDVIESEGALYGDGVNVAARLEALAEPGGVLISEAVYMQVEGKLDAPLAFAGEHRVKNIARPVRAWRIGEAARVATPGPAAPSDLPSIAVLAFENMSADPEQAYFSDGIAEDIITELSKLSGLFVIARNSSFAYKGRNVDLREVSRALGVRYVLEGSVRKAGARVRVTAQLIDGETGGHLWADRFDRDLSDIFAVQDEVTREIVAALEVKLTRDERGRLAAKGTQNAEAYDCFLRARAYPHTSEGFAAAQALLEKAVALDPDFAQGHAALAHLFLAMHEFGHDFVGALFPRVRAEAELALATDPALAVGHYALAKYRYFTDDRDGFLAEAAEAMRLSPNSAGMLADLGRLYSFGLARTAEGAEMARRAVALNPRGPTWYRWPIVTHAMFEERFEDALEEMQRIDEPPVWQLAWLVMLHAKLGHDAEAESYRRRLLHDFPDYSLAMAKRIFHYHPVMLEHVRAWHADAGLPLGEDEDAAPAS